MLNFGASKPRVKGGSRAPGAPPGSAPEISLEFDDEGPWMWQEIFGRSKGRGR